MRELRYSLLLVAVCFVASKAAGQQLEHLHLVCASDQTFGPGANISIATDGGAVRTHWPFESDQSYPFLWIPSQRMWQPLRDNFLGDSLYSSLTICDSGIIYDQLSNGWLVRSTDGGSTFTRLALAPTGVLKLAPDGSLFVLNNLLLMRSTDDGNSWDSISAPSRYSSNYYFDRQGNLFEIPTSQAQGRVIYRLLRGDSQFDSVAIATRFGPAFHSCSLGANTLVLGTNDSIWFFDAKNISWNSLQLPQGRSLYNSSYSNALCCDSSGRIYLGLAGTLLRSDDTGKTWITLDSGTRMIDWVAFQAPSTLWYATDSHVVQRSTITGKEIAVDSPFETLDTWSLAAKGDTVYATVEDDSGFFRSLDNGITWKQVFPDSSLMLGAGPGSSVKFSPDGATYLVAADDADLFQSFGGSKWTKLDTLTYDRYLVIDSAGTAWYSNGTYTTDDGNTWSAGGPPVSLWYVGVTYQGNLCWANDSLFHYSTDEGATWNESKILDTSARGYAFIHSAAGRIWLSYDSVLELSTDGGTTWVRAMSGLTHSPLQEITTDPYGHTFCIQGYFPPDYGWPTTCSIYAWNPSSESWAKLTTDTSLIVYSLCANSKYLFLGTQSGVFRVAIADFNLGVSPPPAQPEMQTALAYPNPASGNFTLRFYLDTPGSAKITIYDVLGNVVYDAPAASCVAGWNSVPILRSLPAGAYNYEVSAGVEVARGHVAMIAR